MRPTKDEYYLHIAREVATRSTCLRSCYGAVLVRNDRILSTGYNGSRRGGDNCVDVGECARKDIPSRTRYELCHAVHAEMNAIINAGCDVSGAKIYIAGFAAERFHFDGTIEEKIHHKVFPCVMCFRQMTNAGIAKVCIRDFDSKPVTTDLVAFDWLERPVINTETGETEYRPWK